MGLFARMAGVVTSPAATYENVVAAPRPFGILFVTAMIMGVAMMLPPLLNPDVLESGLVRNAEFTEKITGQPVTPEQFERMRRQSEIGVYFTPVQFLIMMPIISLLFAAIYWAFFNAILGGMATFKQVLAVVTHSQVIGALGVVLSAPIFYMRGEMTYAGPFTFGALLPMLPEGSVAAAVLGTTNVFTLWGLIVTAIGLGVLYRRKSRNIAIGLIVAYLLIAAAVISTFGRLFGMVN
jgi:hypothetical protein